MFGRYGRGRHDRDEYECGGRGRGRGPGFGGGSWGRGPWSDDEEGGRGGRGFGGGNFMRAGRMFAQGDLRLIALSLIAEQPRHGYEIIKVIEEKTAGWYSPSPGVVYPTLTYLEDAGYVTAESEGARKLYAITDEGKAYLAQNQDFVDAVMGRLQAFTDKIARMRKMFGWGEERPGAAATPPLVEAALNNLREAVQRRLETGADVETQIVEILARAAGEVKKS